MFSHIIWQDVLDKNEKINCDGQPDVHILQSSFVNLNDRKGLVSDALIFRGYITLIVFELDPLHHNMGLFNCIFFIIHLFHGLCFKIILTNQNYLKGKYNFVQILHPGLRIIIVLDLHRS